MHFNIKLDRDITVEEARDLMAANVRVAITYKHSANRVFSFGRDMGTSGGSSAKRSIPLDTMIVREGNEIVGFCFTPQDGNPMLSTLAATLWYLYPDGFDDRLDVIRPYLFREV